MKTLKDIGDIEGKTVLVQVNLDVDVEGGNISPGDALRIEASIPLLEELSKKGAKIVLLGHRGRPGGKVDNSLSLGPIFGHLEGIFGPKMEFNSDPIGSKTKKSIDKLKNGEILLLENLRFYPGEAANDSGFAAELASLGDMYINNDFATSHRSHASFVTLPTLLPSFAGPLVERELKKLSRIKELEGPDLLLIMGGKKAKTKLRVIDEFALQGNMVALGGVLANTFLKKKGLEVGASLVGDSDDIEKGILENKNIILPRDVVVSGSLDEAKDVDIKKIDQVSTKDVIVDIGPETINNIVEQIKKAKTIVWNGALGVTELAEFKKGTLAVAKEFVKSEAEKIVGGGDLVAFLKDSNMLGHADYVSTSGGAMLTLLAGEDLPGLRVLGYAQ